MTVAQVLAPVAWWSEMFQRYVCDSCMGNGRVIHGGQPVSAPEAELLAKDCSKTHCDACGAQIAGKTEEK